MAPKRLPLRLLRFGNIDARYEVLTRDSRTLDHFRESFVTPTGMPLEEFIKGTRFFVHGMKGAGKTAFLRYIQLKMDEDQCLTKFISFASEISDSERERIFKDSQIKIYEQKNIEVSIECVNMWILGEFRFRNAEVRIPPPQPASPSPWVDQRPVAIVADLKVGRHDLLKMRMPDYAYPARESPVHNERCTPPSA